MPAVGRRALADHRDKVGQALEWRDEEMEGAGKVVGHFGRKRSSHN